MQPEGRIHNFGAGPAVLPYEVVQEVSEALPNLSGSGFGSWKSHIAQILSAVIDSAIGRVRSLLSVPDDYEVLLTGRSLDSVLYDGIEPDRRRRQGRLSGIRNMVEEALKEAKRLNCVAAWDGSTKISDLFPQTVITLSEPMQIMFTILEQYLVRNAISSSPR